MATDQPFCKFHQFGHCKFGPHCKKFHTKQTCSNLKCNMNSCTLRHPRQCKFYVLFGRCKFNESCSFLHSTAEDNLIKALQEDILSLKTEIHSLKEKNHEIEAMVLKLNIPEHENQHLVMKTNSVEKFTCEECGYQANTLTVY